MLKHTIVFAVVAVLVFALAPADAQVNYRWDADDGAGGIQDGAGSWELGQPNWNDGTPNVNWVDGTTNVAVFGGGSGGAAGTVTVNGTVAPAGLTFNQPLSGNYTITGGTISLDNGSVAPGHADPKILITNNATGTTTVSSVLNRAYDTDITTAAGSHLILSGGGEGAFYIKKFGEGTLTLEGDHTVGTESEINRRSWEVSGGTMNIAGTLDAGIGRTNGEVKNGATLNITGTFTSGGHDQAIHGDSTVNITGDGRWNLIGGGIFELPVNGTLNIQDNAVLDVDRSEGVPGGWQIGSLSLGMGWGTSTAVINQSGNSVANLDFPTEAWSTADGPGLVLGGVVVKSEPLDISATYNLNGGTLNTSGIFNVNMDGGVLIPPTGPVGGGGNGQIAVFNFNGGTLKASQSDSLDAAVIAEGLDHLMGNLWHAWVKEGGAIIDTNTFNASINQALEHDPGLGETADGGLTKLGAGTLTLLQANSYTGDTVVEDGTLSLSVASLDDGAAVSVFTDAMLDLNFEGTDTIVGLTLGGVPQAAGLHDMSTNPTFFSGIGSLLVIRGNLEWRDGETGIWLSENWTPDGGLSYVEPAGGERMVVNSGTVTVTEDLTVLDRVVSVSVALDAPGGTVVVGSAGTLDTAEVNVNTGGTLNVNGLLSVDSFNVNGGTLGLGDGGMIVSPITENDLSDVTFVVDGTVNAGGGVAVIGDEENDLSTTSLTLADGSILNWTFSPGNDYIDVFGEVTFAGALTIQLVDGGGTASGDDVELFRAVDASPIDASLVTVLSPVGKTWTWDIDGNGDPVFSFVGGEFLVLQGLVTGGGAVPGDANGDQVVDEDDLALFEAQFGGTPGGDSADFDGDGDVDLDDFATLRGNWGFGTGGAPGGGLNVTPEPATMGLLAIGALAVIRRRRKS